MAISPELKSIVTALDRAAGRSEYVDREPATGKQCFFLARLLHERGLDADEVDCKITNTQAVLTKRQASRHIDDLLKIAA